MSNTLTDMKELVAASFQHDDRRTRVRQILERNGLDAIVAIGPRYATWLAGYHRYSGGMTATLIGPSGGVEIVASADEARVVEPSSTATRVHAYGEPGFGLVLDAMPALVSALSRVEMLSGATRYGVAGVDPDQLDLAESTHLLPVDSDLAAVMAVKDRDEAEKMCRAYNLCLEAQTIVEHGVQEGASELELFTRAHAGAQLAAGEPVEFLADLLSGPNGAEVSGPVAVAGPHRPAEGEPVVADILVRVAGYWGDTCRTHIRGSNPEVEELREQLAAVLGEAVAALRPGVRASDAHDAVSRRLLQVFPGSAPLPHHAGHGFGLDPCEAPNLSPNDDSPLEPGMILAIEPGVYFPGRFGMRLENDYLVTPAGGIELNDALAALAEGADR